MVSILVVDDEKNIRAGILKILGGALEGRIECIEARNGEEAFELVTSRCPDLVISDIRMPRMDGLELMRKLSPLPRRPAIVVLSGYDDFSYAKQAMELGASAYILKPVDRDELIAVVAAQVTGIESRQRSETSAILHKASLGSSPLTSPESLFLSPCLPLRFAVCELSALTGKPLQEFLETKCYLLDSRPAAVCVAFSASDVALFRDLTASEAVGLSESCLSLPDIRCAVQHAEMACLCSLFSTSRRLFEWENREIPRSPASLEARVLRLNTMVGSGDNAALIAAVGDIFDTIQGDIWQKAAALLDVHELLESVFIKRHSASIAGDLYLFSKSLMLEKLYSFHSLDEYRHCVIDLAVYLNCILGRDHQAFPFIDQALSYIRENYRKDINMTIVANHVSVNYTYFSEKFKEQTGVNFNEYLKTLRMERAKDLLEKGCHKVYEVASLSGFGDVKYFMKAFKAEAGLSPGEYRKKFDSC